MTVAELIDHLKKADPDAVVMMCLNQEYIDGISSIYGAGADGFLFLDDTAWEHAPGLIFTERKS